MKKALKNVKPITSLGAIAAAVAIMELNITGVDNQLYYDVIVALNVCFFIFLSLLPLLLCVLVILALVLAKTINIKIRVNLINVFAVEVVCWTFYGIFYLAWIVWMNYNETISCKLIHVGYLIVRVQKCSSGNLYAINIFLFIKYGEKKLKWCVIIPYIVLSWFVILIISKKVLIKKLKSVGMMLAKVKEQDGMMLAKVKEQDEMMLAKVKEQDGMMLAKVKEQDWMMLAKVKYVKVPSIPTSVACCDGVQLTNAELLHRTASSKHRYL